MLPQRHVAGDRAYPALGPLPTVPPTAGHRPNGGLPAIEVVSPCTFSPAETEAHEPHDGQDDGSDPEEVHGEADPEKDQNNQQCKQKQHTDPVPNHGSRKTWNV